MPEVLRIEQASQEFPWTEEEFIRALRQRNTIGMVAESGEVVVGYMLYELEKRLLNVINFAVHPGYRYMEVGRQLVEKLRSKLSAHRRYKFVVHVPDYNLDAQLFFKACGLRAERVHRGYYGDYDSYEMAYRLEAENEF